MAQAVSRRPLSAEPRVRSPLSPCGQSGTGTGFSPSTSVSSCQFHSILTPLKWKSRKNLIIFIIFLMGLHNKPQGCGESLASATGPFNKKKGCKSIALLLDSGTVNFPPDYMSSFQKFSEHVFLQMYSQAHKYRYSY